MNKVINKNGKTDKTAPAKTQKEKKQAKKDKKKETHLQDSKLV